jgi:8-oxo-dGTP pyrophosphatase MutT (NUDIX family)
MHPRRKKLTMWLFTTDGFYSIVTAGEFDEEVQVRARAGADLDRLRERWLPELGESVTIPHRDYPWRAFADRRSLADCLSRIALALDYDNFKDAVAEHQSHERAHVYRGVWSACHEIKDEPHAGARPRANGGDAIDYELADLVAIGVWPDEPKSARRYGAVLFDDRGRILLREPNNHFDGYVWTFPKGRPDPGEMPVETARREVLEETGFVGEIVGHVPGVFKGGVTGSANYFYLMYVLDDTGADRAARRSDGETTSICWVTSDEARDLISQSTNSGGRERDLATLEAAVDACKALT